MFLCQCPERKPVLVDVFLPLWATIFSRRRVWVGKPAIELGFFPTPTPFGGTKRALHELSLEPRRVFERAKNHPRKGPRP